MCAGGHVAQREAGGNLAIAAGNQPRIGPVCMQPRVGIAVEDRVVGQEDAVVARTECVAAAAIVDGPVDYDWLSDDQ